jgi:phage/plasmid-associated DNA primase
MFQGFPIKPVEGDCSRYLDLIMDVICNGNQEHYDYLIKWFAHLFQKPAELPGTALVMRGLQGTGKGTMMKYPGQLVGQHYLEVVQMRQVVGHFNAHLKDALLVHANEAVWGGDKASEGAIKAMITDETSAVEFKGRDIQTVKNYKRLVLASNHDWVAPRDMDDRRFFVLDVSDVHKEDQDYFAAIHEEMSAGGLEALMHHLVHVDLTDFNPRMMPETDGAGFDMKLRGMDSVMQWLHEVLNDGVLPADHNNQLAIDHCWPDEYPTASLHALYVNWCRTQNQRHPDPKEIFGGKLRGLLIRKKARKSIRGSRPWYYKLHSLEDCRSKFEAACKEGAYIWSDEDAED